MNKIKKCLLFIGILLGFLAIVQGRSFMRVDSLLSREAQTNVFQEIKILKVKNKDLQNEIKNLENTVEQLQDQNFALEVIEKEINEYMKLSGNYPIFGPGVNVLLDGEIHAPWVIDMINELYNAGAEAVSINGIRISNKASGIDVMPNDQLLINGSILTSPFNLNAIGKSDSILEILELPGGIFDRLEAAYSDVQIHSEMKDVIQMD